MPPSRLLSRLPLAGLLVIVAGALGWLLLVFAGDHGGRRPLPDGMGSTVEVLEDRGRGLTRDVVERIPAGEWRRWSKPGLTAWRNGEALWARVTLRNPEDRPQRGVLADGDYFLDRVDVWTRSTDSTGSPQAGSGQVQEAGDWRHLQSGESVPAGDKALPGRDVAFPVTVPARGEAVVYVRAEDMFAPFFQPRWWPDLAQFQSAQTRSAMAEGIYLGGLFALLGYNLLLWFRLQLADIGYYVLYLGSIACFMLLARGHGVALGWSLPSPRLETLLVLAMGLSGFFLTQFARVFLDLKTQPRSAQWAARALQVLTLVVALGALTTPLFRDAIWLKAAVHGIGVTHVALLVLAVWAWRRGVRQARFFVLSFGCLFAGSLPAVAAWIWENSLKATAMQGLMIGSGLEILLLSLATADRFAQAQRRLVEETEQRRAIQEAYADELETEVRERTRELQEANEDKDRMIAVIGHDLRSPLTGLMKSADQATGEFARETVRTGRALLLMIEDLVLWARLRAGSRVVSGHPARALIAPAVALHRAIAEHSGTELVLEVPEGLRVETDLVLAQTLVRNLLANALKFARTKVVLRAEAGAHESVRFTVSNDGPPLPAAVAARLAANEDEPMTAMGGLGLRLCREICRALEMRLEARAPAEGGAEFGFTMRAAETLVEENA
jgi:two-component system, sensor histidine kinase LadS